MENQKYKNPYTYVGYLVWTLNNIMSNAMADNYKGAEKLPFSHMMVLSSLYWQMCKEKNINQKDLANFTHMKEITISVTLRKLHTLKLIDFEQDKKDKRAKIVKINKNGEKLIRDFLNVAIAFDKKISTRSPEFMFSLRTLVEELSYRHR
ncbi:MAG: winged helix DNA-binding protein [Patescibacteria group bacterium]